MPTKPVDLSGRLAAWKAETPDLKVRLVEEMRATAKARGLSRVVIGISGGLDSATAAALCAQALGSANVLGILMPHRATSSTSLSLSQGVVNALGITARRVNLSPLVDAYFSNFPDATRARRGLGAGWLRTGVLVDLGHHYAAHVVQALNRSDRVLRYGDAVHAIETALKPLGSLWKSQVRFLAEALGVMPEVRARRPSLEYWAGQSDEADLGWPYDDIDPLLDALVEGTASAEELSSQAASPEAVRWAVVAIRAGVPLGAPGPAVTGRTG
jgi:NAD+ synthase